jgi:cytochrome c oxidase subunit 1
VKGKAAPANPWGAKGLEWTIPSPPPTFNFDEDVVVTEPAYDYKPPREVPQTAGRAGHAFSE